MWASIIAVAGTLAGVLVSGLLAARTARRTRREDRAEADRHAGIDAITALSEALADHRRTMWVYRHAAITPGRDGELVELQQRAHETRAAITAPATRVRLLIHSADVHAAADAAIAEVYAMRDAASLADLTSARGAAHTAAGDVVRAAAAHLATTR